MKKAKILIVVLLVAIISTLTISFSVFPNKTSIAKDSLKNNIDSYNTVVEYLTTLIEENSIDDYICFGIDGSTKKNIVLSVATENGEILEMNSDVATALSVIKSAFYDDMGYTLDTIRIKGGCIFFDTIDGQYSLILAVDENVNVNSLRKENTDAEIKKDQDNWYHKFS